MYNDFFTETIKISSSTPTFTSEVLLQQGERVAVFYRTGASLVSDFSNELVLSAQSDCSCVLTLQMKPPGADIWFDVAGASWTVIPLFDTLYEIKDIAPEPCSVRLGTKNASAYSDGNIWVRLARGY